MAQQISFVFFCVCTRLKAHGQERVEKMSPTHTVIKTFLSTVALCSVDPCHPGMYRNKDRMEPMLMLSDGVIGLSLFHPDLWSG